MKYVMGTGCRSLVTETAETRMAVCNEVTAYILSMAASEPITLISGMAEGWDELIALIGYRHEIPYIAVIPNTGYGRYYWQNNSITGRNRIQHFNRLLGRAQSVEYVCGSRIRVDGVHANFHRNQRMVQMADFALVYKSWSPGTRHAVGLLQKSGTPFYEFSGIY